MNHSIEKLRCDYGNTPLDEKDLLSDPLDFFQKWWNEALSSSVREPNGMTLSTISSAGRPSSRTVLLKEVKKEGFCFYTNYESRKAEHLRLNPYASLTFWWREIYRQVNVEGRVKKLTRKEADRYFHIRPKEAQIAACASKQSSALASREELLESFSRLKQKYRGVPVPCPKMWGGYCVIPERIEFWQGRKSRLHDRFLYVKTEEGWVISRLAP